MLITGPELALHLRVDYDSQPAALDQAATLGCGIVTGNTRQQIEAGSYLHTLPVAADGTVAIPQRPVTSVASVAIGGTELPADGWSWDGVSPWLTLAAPPAVPTTVVVAYDAGYDPVPGDVKAVALALAARRWLNGAGLRSESVDDYQVSYGDDTLSAVDADVLARYGVAAATVTPA